MRTTLKPNVLTFFLYLFIFFAESNAQVEPILPRITEEAPILDGILNDEVWTKATKIEGFQTYDPDFGKPLPFETSVQLLYDHENLYFSFRCLDPEPEKIKASVDSRDQIVADDWICINLDSYFDQQVLSAFYVNPYGIQMDSRFSAGREDPSVDFVWYSAGKVDSTGYSIEVQIPLKSLRFAKSEAVIMGMIFERRISRLGISGTYPPLDPDQGMAFLNQMYPVKYKGIKPAKLIELMPAITYSNKKQEQEGSFSQLENKVNPSLTMKIGITPQIVMDLTANPDFSQIEADAGQIDVNLRYQLYFPEKRLFFQEGSEHYTVGATRSSVLDPISSMVHTRNIISPVAGLKLAGRAGSKSNFALMYAADRDQEGNTGVANIPVLRYKRSLKQDGFVGGLYTGRIGPQSENHAGGLDGRFRISKSAVLEYHAFGSSAPKAAGTGSNNDIAAGIYLHNTSRDFDFSLSSKHIGENFQTENGYITRIGVTYFTGLVKPKIYTESKLFRRFDIEVFSGQLRDNIFGMWETFNHISVLSVLSAANIAKVKYSYSTEIFLGERFNTGGIHLMFNTQISRNLSFGILYRGIGAIYYSTAPFQGKTNNITSSLSYLVSDKLHADVDLVYQDFHRSDNGSLEYRYLISRGKLSYQLNKYLFFRSILEYNSYKKEILADLLASFTYIPGTVIHIGYGSLFKQLAWNENSGLYEAADSYLKSDRGLFFKASYLHRF